MIYKKLEPEREKERLNQEEKWQKEENLNKLQMIWSEIPQVRNKKFFEILSL